MATREENLKKINDELEKLSDEQLEKVAGGINRTRPKTQISLRINRRPPISKEMILEHILARVNSDDPTE